MIHGTLPDFTYPIRVSSEPIVDLGGLRDDPAEEMIARRPFLLARPLSNKQWVAIDWAELKIFDGSGKLRGRIGKSGPGPGEFRQIRDVCVAPGDTLVVVTTSDRRATVFDASGKLVRTFGMPGEVRDSPCFPDGSVLARVPTSNPSARPVDHIQLDAAKVDWRAGTVQRLSQLPSEGTDPSFPEFSNAAVGIDFIAVGNGGTAEYHLWTMHGRRTQVVRWVAQPVVVTGDMRNSQVRRGFGIGPNRREHLPAYAKLKVGPDGQVWVQDYPWPPNAQTGYSVFDRSGAFLGRWTPPQLGRGPVEMQWVTNSTMLLSWRDSDGVPHLTIHAVRGP